MIQSLLTQDEYDEMSKKYTTYNPSKRKGEKMESVIIDGIQVLSGPPPNYIMGDSFTPKEIKVINQRYADVLKKAGLTLQTELV